MILRNQLLSEWGWEYIFDHIDDEDKLTIDRLTTKNSARLKSLTNQENSNQMKNKKIDKKSDSQIVSSVYILLISRNMIHVKRMNMFTIRLADRFDVIHIETS